MRSHLSKYYFLLFFLLTASHALAEESLFDFIKAADPTIKLKPYGDGNEDNTLDKKEAYIRVKKILKKISSIQGKGLTLKDWPYAFQGYRTKINTIVLTEGKSYLGFELGLERISDGETITSNWMPVWKVEGDHTLILYTDFIAIKPKHRLTTNLITAQIHEQEYRFLQQFSDGRGRLELSAVGIGAYVWATRGFKFKRTQYGVSAGHVVLFKKFTEALKQEGIQLSAKELSLFREPYHFAAFDTGEDYVIKAASFMPLNAAQLKSQSLVAIPGKYPLEALEIEKKETRRMIGHFGKAFLIEADEAWDGEIQVRDYETTEAAQFADAYKTWKRDAYQVLPEDYEKMIDRVRAVHKNNDHCESLLRGMPLPE